MHHTPTSPEPASSLPSLLLNDLLALAKVVRCPSTRAGRQEVARLIVRSVGDARTYLDETGAYHPELGRPTLEGIANRYRDRFPDATGDFDANNPDHRDSLRMALDAIDEAQGLRVNRTEQEVAA